MVFLGNVIAVEAVSAVGSPSGFVGGLTVGGQLIDALIVLAVAAALGATYLLFRVGEWWAASHGARAGEAVDGAHRIQGIAIAGLALVVVLPSLVFHYTQANHRIPAVAENYAHRVLSSLPRNAVFIAGGWEYAEPIMDRQIVHHERPDVALISGDVLEFAWYQEQLVRRFHLDPALAHDTSATVVADFVAALRKSRPVYIDGIAMENDADEIAYVDEGLIARVVDGKGPQPGTGVDAASAALRRIESADDVQGRTFFRFPNFELYFLYERAHVELAKEYGLAKRYDDAANELTRALTYMDANHTADALIASLRAHNPSALPALMQL
jgi:hypothetical protein